MWVSIVYVGMQVKYTGFFEDLERSIVSSDLERKLDII